MHRSGPVAKRVLVIEDDPVVAMVLEELLQQQGLEVIIDLSLSNALTEIDGGDFDAALLDMELRGESARPALLALLACNLPFFVISGHDQAELKKEFPQVKVLVKPLKREELIRQVGLLLDQT